MNTKVIAIVGAGPGVGLSVARRFAAEGYAVGLVARNRDRLAELASALGPAVVAVATADAHDPQQVDEALSAIRTELGEPSVLCFSPIPDIDLIKPVLATRPDELIDSLQLGVAGAAAVVASVLPAMVRRNEGTLLFTTGSAAISPHPDRAASAVTTAAATAYVALLGEALADTGVVVGHTVVVGPIGADPNSHHPDDVAADLWSHHTTGGPLRTILQK